MSGYLGCVIVSSFDGGRGDGGTVSALGLGVSGGF